jgi:glycosyltransferase involved in cell wall biosynthesis
MRRLNILYINTFDPFVEVHGGATVTRAELKHVSTVANVTTLFGEPLRSRAARISWPRLLIDLCEGKSLKQASYNVLHRPLRYFEPFDLIYCNHDFAAYDYQTFVKIGKPFVVRKLNAEHRFYSQAGPLHQIERARILHFEQSLGRSAAAVIHLSSSEFAEDDYSHNKHLLFPPLASDQVLCRFASEVPYRHADRPIDILCVTNYEWRPNRQGFDWFFDEVEPRLVNGTSIHLVGKGSERYAGRPQVTCHGFVDDVSSFYSTAKVFIAPVFTGAGIKIKNLEAMIYGIPILTTPLGADGFADVLSAGGVAVEATPDGFASRLQTLLADERLCAVQRSIGSDWVRKNVHGSATWTTRIEQILNEAVA